ncbi:hypothetical protein D770_04670 [Flammeovirgaceae bacterium 311]|nr:hypothetical protein D770_04670 [Flammeovirgaceae bacterium 311]
MEQNKMPNDNIPAAKGARKNNAGVKGKRGMFEIEKLEQADPAANQDAGNTADDTASAGNKSSGGMNSGKPN